MSFFRVSSVASALRSNIFRKAALLAGGGAAATAAATIGGPKFTDYAACNNGYPGDPLAVALNFLEVVGRTIQNSVGADFDGAFYVARPKFESRLSHYLEAEEGRGRICVVAGPTGIGKTTLVNHVCSGKKGVLRVDVNDLSPNTTVAESLLIACGLNLQQVEPPTKGGIVLPILHSAIKIYKEEWAKGQTVEDRYTVPTFVFHVEGKKSEPGSVSLSQVYVLAKYLATSPQYLANVIVVVEGLGALDFYSEAKRTDFVWIDELNRQETGLLLMQRGVCVSNVNGCEPVPSGFNWVAKTGGLTKKHVDSIFDQVGGLGVDLEILVRNIAANDAKSGSGSTKLSMDQVVDKFIKATVDDARGRLGEFAHKPIVAALKERPEGIHALAFDGIKDEGVLLSSPVAVAKGMKEMNNNNAVQYHIPSGEYRLQTTAHKTAIKNYNLPQESMTAAKRALERAKELDELKKKAEQAKK